MRCRSPAFALIAADVVSDDHEGTANASSTSHSRHGSKDNGNFPRLLVKTDSIKLRTIDSFIKRSLFAAGLSKVKFSDMTPSIHQSERIKNESKLHGRRDDGYDV